MALRCARLPFRGQILSGPQLLKERDPTKQLSASVGAGSGRSLCSRTDEAGTGTPGAMRDNFPWRQAPPSSRPGFMQRIVQNIVHRRLLRAVADENFMRGAEMAFMTVTATLFKLKMSNMRDKTERSKDELQADVERHLVTEMETGPWSSGASNAESDEADDSPRLDGIDSELFSFVKRTEDATRGRGAIPYYRLHAIIPPAAVSNVLCITGAIRGDDISRLEVFNYPGFLHFQDGEILDERLGTVWSNIEANVEKTMLRVDLDFNCFETFFVRDRDTKEIIQGSEEPQLRTHRITLEASPIKPSTVRWKVIDLDDWMDGNRFW